MQLVISYLLESADISVGIDDQDLLNVSSKQGLLVLLPLSLQKGVEQHMIEYEFPLAFVAEMAVAFLLDPDTSSFEDCQIGVQTDRVCLQQHREAHQSEAA